ncbi:MAG: ATP synthase subunit I [Pseudomonadota bacterium]
MQVALVMLVSAAMMLGFGLLEARSAFLGGMAGFLPNVYFAFRISRSRGGEARKIVRSFYAGESGKLIMTALLFFLIFQLSDIMFMPLLAGFVAVIAAFWVALLQRD